MDTVQLFLQAQGLVENYYTPREWRRIVAASCRAHGSILDWNNFSRNEHNETLGALPYPTAGTYSASIRIGNYNINLELLSDRPEIIIKPHWWSSNNDGWSIMDELPATPENIRRILSTVTLSPYPAWVQRLNRRVRSFLNAGPHTVQYWSFKWYYFRRHHLTHWDIYSNNCIEDTLREYFRSEQLVWLRLSGQLRVDYQSSYSGGPHQSTTTITYHGWQFVFEYQSVSDESKRLGRWPYPGQRMRLIIHSPIPGTIPEMFYNPSRRQFRRFLSYIERDWVPTRSYE
jgi:hypothetical protein